MKFHTQLILILIGLAFNFSAVGQVILYGKVYDSKHNLIPYASVIAMKGDGIISASVSDSTGGYRLNLNVDFPITIVAKMIGYKEQRISLHSGSASMLDITLLSTSISTDEVSVIGKKPILERKIDRYIFNVQNSIAIANSDAFEAINITPGIYINKNDINIIGKGVANIMINDRIIPLAGDDLKEYLKNIPSDQIASIEVITNPPSNYDASGSGGLINIKLKKISKDDFSGMLSGKLSQNSYTSENIGLSLNMNKKKLTFTNYIFISHNSLKPIGTQEVITKYYTRNDLFERVERRKSITDRFAADLELSKNHNIGIEVLYTASSPSVKQLYDVAFNGELRFSDSSQISNLSTKNYANFISSNVHYNGNLDTMGRKILLNLDYFKNNASSSSNTIANNYIGSQIIGQQSNLNLFSDQNVNTFTATADVDYPTPFASIKLGAKTSLMGISNYSSVYNSRSTDINLNNSNYFDYNENTQAIYLNAEKSISKRLEMQGGIRIENTHIKAASQGYNSDISIRYIKAFPTLYLSYKLKNDHILTMNYGRRINRPYFKLLNPFRWYENFYTYTSGNPELLPSIGQSIEIGYNYSSNFSMNLELTNTDNSIKELTINNTDGIQSTIPYNYYTSKSYSISSTYIYNKLKWFESTNSINAFNYIVLANLDAAEQRISQFSFYASSQNSFVLSSKRGIRLNVNPSYTSPFLDGVYKYNAYYDLSIALQFSLFSKKLSARLIANDILRTQKNNYTASYNEQMYRSNNYYDRRMLSINLQYRFGNKKIKSKNINNSNVKELERLN